MAASASGCFRIILRAGKPHNTHKMLALLILIRSYDRAVHPYVVYVRHFTCPIFDQFA